jgi:hypothetical protein
MIDRKFRPYTKAEIVEAIQSLPEDATIDDAMERLYFLAKIEIARSQIAEGDVFTQDEIEREMARTPSRYG